MEDTGHSVVEGTYVDPSGRFYLVMGVAQNVATQEMLVIYTSQRGERAGLLCAQSVGTFMSELKRGNFKYRGKRALSNGRLKVKGSFFDKKA